MIKNITLLLCLFLWALSSQAMLVGRLEATPGAGDYQAYYDTDADLTWLADAYLDYQSSLNTATARVANLDVGGVTGWRLPETERSCVYEYNCTGSEMANLFYNVLGNTAGSLTNTGPFTEVRSADASGYYWLDVSADFGMYFHMGSGLHGSSGFNVDRNVWAVHSGDVEPSAVPIPASLWLFGSGLIGLVGFARRKGNA